MREVPPVTSTMKTFSSVVVTAAIIVSLAAAQGRESSSNVAGRGNVAIHSHQQNETVVIEPRAFYLNRDRGNTAVHSHHWNGTHVIEPRAFDLDRDLRQSSGEGSNMKVHQVKASDEDYVLSCGQGVILSPGASLWIKSKNFPKAYPNNQECDWLIYGAELEVTCGRIIIQRSRSCRKDFLYFQYNKTSQDEYLIVCGREKKLNLEAKDYIYALFKTDRRGNKKGYSCRITNVAEPVTTESPTKTTTPESSTTTTAPSSDECRCGKINNVARIVGGQETTPNKYPWQIALVANGAKRPFCGGSIISQDWILTAAHCVDDMDTTDQVLVGEHNWKTSDNTMERLDIEKIIVHKDYDSRTLDNDIALIKLKSPISFPDDNDIAPICLPPNLDYDNVKAVVTGWGNLYSGGNQPKVLHEVEVTTITNVKCASKYANDNLNIAGGMLCAEEVGKDACNGDSGGPLIRVLSNTSQSTYQIGVVSWGIGCANRKYPGVYTRVTNYLNWIDGYISGSKTCEPI